MRPGAGYRHSLVPAFIGIASMLAHSGRDEDAALLLGAADSIFLPPISTLSENRAQTLAVLNEHLGDERLAVVLARGATMTDDEAVAHVRDEARRPRTEPAAELGGIDAPDRTASVAQHCPVPRSVMSHLHEGHGRSRLCRLRTERGCRPATSRSAERHVGVRSRVLTVVTSGETDCPLGARYATSSRRTDRRSSVLVARVHTEAPLLRAAIAILRALSGRSVR